MSNNIIVKIFSIFVFVTLLLTSCSSEDKEQEAPRTTTKDALSIGILPVDECLPYYVAEHLGLLDSLHADVRVVKYKALSECRNALAAHEIDHYINDSSIHYRFFTSKKARLHRISQLSDRVIAADGEGYSKRIVEENIDSLLKLKRHIFIIRVEDLDVRTKMLVSNSVDAAILPEPWATQAKKAGAYELKIKPADSLALKAQPFPKVSNAKLSEALSVAKDSIRKYGKQNYYPLFQ